MSNLSLKEKFADAASNNSGRVHLIQVKEGWAIKKEGLLRASAIKASKSDAMKVAQKLTTTGHIVIHSKNGSVQSQERK